MQVSDAAFTIITLVVLERWFVSRPLSYLVQVFSVQLVDQLLLAAFAGCLAVWVLKKAREHPELFLCASEVASSVLSSMISRLAAINHYPYFAGQTGPTGEYTKKSARRSYSAEGLSCHQDHAEIIQRVKSKEIPLHAIENHVSDPLDAVQIRREFISQFLPDKSAMDNIPHEYYMYSKVLGTCCENVIGYLPVPLGVAGPLLLNDNVFMVPMATTEGCLVASTNRGCAAIRVSGGVSAFVYKDGMTRGPALSFPSAKMAVEFHGWISSPDNFLKVKAQFDSTSRFARLKNLKPCLAGRNIFLQFKAFTGDAMGMNMVSKGVEKCLQYLLDLFPDMTVVSLSGNYCVDKKPSALNWIEGRGKSVVAEAFIKSECVKKVLKSSVEKMVNVNTQKNLVGSSMAGSVGGNNAQAANIVAAVFIATGQDAAQTVGSSNCITLMETHGNDLHVSVTMPCLEVGTVGGGTNLPPQAAALKMLGLHGGRGGLNSSQLAMVVCATVLAGELSLIAALAEGHLVRSHLNLNRPRCVPV